MAVTLERLAEGIKRANAAGDVETVKKLGTAYRQMQAGSGADMPPAGAKPGSREYADWALAQARAGNKLPQVSEAPEFEAPKPNGLMDKAFTAAGSFLEGMPVIGSTAIDLAKKGRSAVQGMTPEEVDAEYAAAKEANPITSVASGIGGSIAALAPLGATAVGGRLLGMTGGTGARIGMGMASGGTIAGADTLTRGGDIGDIAGSALLGTALGGVLPAIGGVARNVGQKLAQNKATTAAIKGAPGADDLKSAASDLFKQVDASGVTVDTPMFSGLVKDLATKAKKMRINPNLDPKATGAFQELIGALDDVQKNGGALTVSDLHTLRQIAQRAAVSSEGRDAMFSNLIVDGLDDFVTKPGATVGGGAGGKELKEAIATWGRARRVGLVEEAIDKAQNAASGFENGLRVEFRKILNNKKLRMQFDENELKEMARVVQGTAASNLAKLLGKFGFGPGANGLGGFLGGTAGLTFGGPVGAVATAAAASGARKLSEKMTEAAAERAAKVVATPNIPKIRPSIASPELVAPAVLPLEATKKRQPIEITVTGGAL